MRSSHSRDSVLAEAVYTFGEVCRVRRYAREPVLFVDLAELPGIYRGMAGLGWDFRLQDTKKLMAVTEEGSLYWATRTWRLRGQPDWLPQVVGDYYLVAQKKVESDEGRLLCDEIVNGLLRALALKEDNAEGLPHG